MNSLSNWQPCRWQAKGILAFCLCLPAAIVTAQAPHVYDSSVCAPDGIALGGYDAVSYHLGDAPLPGDATFSVRHGELTYRFANQENLQTFAANPEQYTPTYLGWCSATLSMGRLACPDYANFKIEHGKLLLFERVGFTNGRDLWNADPQHNRRQADKHFNILTQR